MADEAALDPSTHEGPATVPASALPASAAAAADAVAPSGAPATPSGAAALEVEIDLEELDAEFERLVTSPS